MKLKLLPIWRLKVRSKVGQIKKDSRRFSVSCRVVKPPFCILNASSPRTRLVLIHPRSRRADLLWFKASVWMFTSLIIKLWEVSCSKCLFACSRVWIKSLSRFHVQSVGYNVHKFNYKVMGGFMFKVPVRMFTSLNKKFIEVSCSKRRL